MAVYEAKNAIPASTKCECGHTWAAHGSQGLICAACPCKSFVQKAEGEE